MDTLITLLLNLVYGLLFIAAFAVLIGTVFLFAIATWEKVIKPLLHRNNSTNNKQRVE